MLMRAQDFRQEIVGVGIPTSPGTAEAMIAFNVEDADYFANVGLDFLLCVEQTTPGMVSTMLKSSGVMTTTGGLLCHAAITCRAWGLPCLCSVRFEFGMDQCQHFLDCGVGVVMTASGNM